MINYMSKHVAKIPAIISAIGIYYFSSLPQAPFVLTTFQLQDKVLHLFAYMFFGATLALAIHTHNKSNLQKNGRWILILGCLYAFSDEYHQSFVPGRTSETGDIIADCLGILIATLLYTAVMSKKARRS
jgi:VanZ family protein